MVAAADADGADADGAGPGDRLAHRPVGQPQARQIAPVPQQRRRGLHHHLGLAGDRHPPVAGMVEIGAGQLQPVRRVAHEVGGDQQPGGDFGLVGVEARGGEQCPRELFQLLRLPTLAHRPTLA